jgi:hypothetical protein
VSSLSNILHQATSNTALAGIKLQNASDTFSSVISQDHAPTGNQIGLKFTSQDLRGTMPGLLVHLAANLRPRQLQTPAIRTLYFLLEYCEFKLAQSESYLAKDRHRRLH